MLLIFTHFAYCPELFDESTIETISFSFFGFAIFFYNFTPITPVARVSHNYFLFHYFCFIIVVVAFSSFLLILSACSNVVHIYHLTYKFGYLNNINLSITTTSSMIILFFVNFIPILYVPSRKSIRTFVRICSGCKTHPDLSYG